jgi:hypothetical protein
MLAMFILLLESMVMTATGTATTRPPLAVRTIVADGSIWADSWCHGSLSGSQRLRAPAPHERWLAVDVNGDGQTDLVSIALDAGASRVELWLAGPDGFVRTAALSGSAAQSPAAAL